MKALFILISIAFFHLSALGQNSFKIKFSNQKNDSDVLVRYHVVKDNGSTEMIDSILVPVNSQKEKEIKVKSGRTLRVFPTSIDVKYLNVARTHEQLKSKQLIEGNSPLNVNIIRIEDISKTSVEVAQLMDELSTNIIFRKLLDTNDVKLDDKLRIGSFLIYNETDKKIQEIFSPTNDWYNVTNLDVFNRYDETHRKTTTKQSSAKAGLKVPNFISIGAKTAKQDYFDFIWKVYNFREEKFGVSHESPQTLLTKYPKKTGFDLFKSLYTTDKSKNYKVYFISAWSLTDSIVTFVDDYIGVAKKAEFDFSYPPSGVKVFGGNAGTGITLANSEYRASIKKNIYNYFEITDITSSAIMEVQNDVNKEEKEKLEDIRTARIKELDEAISRVSDQIINMYKSIRVLDNRYIESNEIAVISQIKYLKHIVQEVPDSLSKEKIHQIKTENIEAATFNSFVDYIETKNNEYNKYLSMKDQLLYTQNMVVVNAIRSDPIPTVRRMTDEEMNALEKFSSRK
ncbi:hypothetical protein [Sphingobacterium sp.]|uniref:hypothetical protein n=1 Tax=Sphingobacterium sp. TaxID=341027 RepID=UPI002899FA08|nr:hypothetical protein [Sphingobacterium sp.]